MKSTDDGREAGMASPARALRSYRSFEDAYRSELRAVVDAPTFQNAPRGNASREVLGVGFQIDDPVDRFPWSRGRRANLVFCYAEALWYLSGSNELQMIEHYAPRIRRYSSDEMTLPGSGYGPRIFGGSDDINQWNSVKRVLSHDPDSKRAVIQIFRAEELSDPDSLDVACTLNLQFLRRDDALHCVAFMRANDAFRGIVSDIFSFTLMQELLARELDLAMGSYTHLVGSFHVYDPDLEWAQRFLQEEERQLPGAFPQMPPGDNRRHIDTVVAVEQLIRSSRTRMETIDFDRLELPQYWRDVVALFEVHRRIQQNEDWADLAAFLPAAFVSALITRWPDSAPRSIRIGVT